MTFDPAGAVWFVLDVSSRAVAAAAAVALVLWVLRLRDATLIHSAWSAVLLAMLLMPVLLSVVPAIPLPVPGGGGSLLHAVGGLEAPSPERSGALVVSIGVSDATQHQRPVARAGTAESVAVTGARGSRAWIPLVLLGVYGAGVLLAAARLIYGWCLASAMVRRAAAEGSIGVAAAPGSINHPRSSFR